MKKMKKVLAVALSLVMAGSLAACGSSSTETKAPETGASETAAESTAESGSEAASEVSTDGKVYNIGICQLIQHDALDAATKGFEDALTEVFGDNVKFDEQNAQGDSATCATIINGFVSNNDDLILANATAALQAAAAGTDTIPILGTSVTDYGVALDLITLTVQSAAIFPVQQTLRHWMVRLICFMSYSLMPRRLVCYIAQQKLTLSSRLIQSRDILRNLVIHVNTMHSQILTIFHLYVHPLPMTGM